ncbi:hypothetical protein QL285_050002 [Trifolium repens]|nr:hypothetical protein QL285_050002 [Trifolium repens]
MEPFCIPWPCVDPSPKPIQPENIQPKPLKSFVQAVANVCEIPLSQLPQACFKGDELVIGILEEEYMAGIDACKHNLHGRIIWPKGATPLTVAALKSTLTPLWKDLSTWGVSSLGKGFYEFVFSTLEDVRRVRSIASWNLSPGSLKLFAWTKDFNPRSQQNVSTQVWVRFYGLSQEYWRPNILFTIASSIGTPICIDSYTAKPMLERTFGQFVRVLVDMDLSQTLRYKVLVERKGFAFYVEMDYENLPQFCSNCKIIGHHVGVCKKLNFGMDDKFEKEVREKNKPMKEVHKVYVQSKDGKTGQKLVNEVINVESDKVAAPINTSKSVEMNSKKNEAYNVLDASSSLKNEAHKSHKSQKSMSHNRFVVLDETIGVDLNNANIQTSQNSSDGVVNIPSFVKGKDIVTVLEPVEIFLEQDRRLEDDLNKVNDQQLVDNDFEDTSSQGSFVESTQVISHNSACNDSEKRIETPDRVIKDMDFLKNSWANMVENEDEEARLTEFLEKEPTQSADGFQIKLSKGQKRSQKKQNQSSRDSYATRSRVNPKPFK